MCLFFFSMYTFVTLTRCSSSMLWARWTSGHGGQGADGWGEDVIPSYPHPLVNNKPKPHCISTCDWGNLRKWPQPGVASGPCPPLVQSGPPELSWHADQRIRPPRRHRVKSTLEKGKGMQGGWGTCWFHTHPRSHKKESRRYSWGPHTCLHQWQLVSRGYHRATTQCLKGGKLFEKYKTCLKIMVRHPLGTTGLPPPLLLHTQSHPEQASFKH